MQPRESGNDFFACLLYPEGLSNLRLPSSEKPQEEEKQIWDQNISMVSGRALAMPRVGHSSRPTSNRLQLQRPTGGARAGDTQTSKPPCRFGGVPT